MTTEIAILNKTAVALAADSAVSSQHKIFPTAEKIFTLSKHHPVGIMVYSAANFMGTPWETIIKVFRDRIGTKHFSTVAEYAQEFRLFLQGLPCDTENEAANVYFGLDSFISQALNKAGAYVDREANKKDSLSKEEVDTIVCEVLLDEFEILKQQHNAPITNSFSEEEFCSTYAASINEAYKQIEPFSSQISDLYIKFKAAAYALFSKTTFEPSYSGVVVAGFGEDQFFPAVSSFKVGLSLRGNLHWIDDLESQISHKTPSDLMAFAQRDMIEVFTAGVHPHFESMIQSLFYNMINDFTSMLNESAQSVESQNGEQANNIREFAKSYEKKLTDSFHDEIHKYKYDNHVGPILKIVSILPKSELALFAETLVNLTGIKRRMSFDRESVGGPTDVAIITKGDGFVWIKRKHYFDPSLNHHFFQNYFGDKNAE
ncbi:hypothetical protein [Maridesulfovibrio sp.]|uniref:hypothetical protein n=1 Tax=Maridesulfovibrio sp. TaxID=2795000 RepID=UPI0029C9FA42|nr:hypothetical protein [Maridesulfovibrio sp.]